jgi:ankyrin repeat protein
MRKLCIRLIAIVAFLLAPHAIPAAPATDRQVSDRALLMAAEAGRADLVGFALDHGADPQARDTRAGAPTALMLAAAGGHAEVVTLLLARGADANAADSAGVTPLMLAANLGHTTIVDALLALGADPRARANDGWSAAEAARMAGEEALAQRIERAAQH